MFKYGRSNFTWNGTLKELERTNTGVYRGSGSEGRRFMMTAPPTSSSGLEVLLSTLQNVGDVDSTINILNVLDELLSAGSDRRILYMVSKGASESLLSALVHIGLSFSPDYRVLLPLLHLLAKVGHRDPRIGAKAQSAGAVLLTLKLLRHNLGHSRRMAAFLWVLQVYCSS
ncbi:cytosolic carboxypeptidase 4-like, partial [Sphaeramia orbicularis]|uniref:cytosolic carboxypeptidase 4-like n=1 Tax=Sphaeramia orbicularis TaxID=375764 RepID=UPI0011807086